MKKLLIIICVLFSLNASSQIIVNGQDINAEADIIELYAFKKPFNTKEVYFINYGQDNFKLHYYDHKRQAVFNAEGVKFEKGEWLQLYKSLKENGWDKIDEREESLGDVNGRVMTFEKKK